MFYIKLFVGLKRTEQFDDLSSKPEKLTEKKEDILCKGRHVVMKQIKFHITYIRYDLC